MTEKQVVLDIDDERMDLIADVLRNKTSKKILSLLSEKDELSEGDIASELKIPLNTIDYNMKKLLKAGLIEECKKFFWSVKGKKIKTFSVARKKIVISPRKLTKGIIPAAIISSIIALGIRFYLGLSSTSEAVMDKSVGSSEMLSLDKGFEGVVTVSQAIPNSWAWYLIGALSALLMVVLWKWNKRFLKGGN